MLTILAILAGAMPMTTVLMIVVFEIKDVGTEVASRPHQLADRGGLS
jgi:hypothetical protein